MSAARIASRYARSLIELAQETGKLDRILEDMDALKEMMRNRDLVLLLRSPVIVEDKKTAALKQLFDSYFDDLTMRFIFLLVKKGREAFLPEIIQEFIEQYKEIRKIFTLKLRTARKFDQSDIDHLLDRLHTLGVFLEGTVEVDQQVDPDLIGGFVLQYNDYIYDATVSRQLDEMRRKEFHGNLYRNLIRRR